MYENNEGIEAVYNLVFQPTLKGRDPKLDARIHDKIEDVEALVKVKDLKSLNQPALHKAGEELAVLLQMRRRSSSSRSRPSAGDSDVQPRARIAGASSMGGRLRGRRADARPRPGGIGADRQQGRRAAARHGTQRGPARQPTELFYSELAGGKRSYLLNLGDLLFSSPGILGGVARQAGISCGTCHQQGAGNAKLFVPGMSTRPGNFDTSGPLFNPKADNGVLDPVRPPSLRGAKYLAPYGHDGRFASLRDFVRNVIVNEFAGAEPSAQILDALVDYIQEISFLPNPKLGAGGRLSNEASDAARRGETLFNTPFRHDAAMSCASCHQPSAAFVDHQVHDVGTGGWEKTPTLVNANFNAPYFHDGRYDNYQQVVEYFDRHFDLGLAANERSDLIAYLDAVGDAKEPYTQAPCRRNFDGDRGNSGQVLDTAIPNQREWIAPRPGRCPWERMARAGEKLPARSRTPA